MGLLDFAKIRYTDSQATNTASQQVGMNLFATTGINPFLPAASAYPMGMSLFVNPNFDIPYVSPIIPNIFDYGTVVAEEGSSKEKTKRKNKKKVNNSLESAGYDAKKGQRLARTAQQSAHGFVGKCATYVKKDIERAGLGKYQYGHAYQCDDILDANPNFKQISTDGLDLKDLPAGCILVYDRGVAGYSASYGHIEITDGKGNAYSDGKTKNIRAGAKVYVPVSNSYLA